MSSNDVYSLISLDAEAGAESVTDSATCGVGE